MEFPSPGGAVKVVSAAPAPKASELVACCREVSSGESKKRFEKETGRTDANILEWQEGGIQRACVRAIIFKHLKIGDNVMQCQP